MQYTKMIELLEQAKLAGESDLTGYVNEQLWAVYCEWRDSLGIGEITDQEDEALYIYFQDGYGLCSAKPGCHNI